MSNAKPTFNSIDDYIATFPPEVQQKLEEMRAIIKAAAPGATEKISYQVPTFYLKGNVVSFGAYKTHIGFYPAPHGIDAFEDELAPYKSGKGTAQFPLDQPLPVNLITRIVQFRVEENLQKSAEKSKKGK
jgi:uncharacterized protein YdhG (YjbR/CyaY superfamily)